MILRWLNRYGLHLTYNSYYICHDKERVKSTFQAMRDAKVSHVLLYRDLRVEHLQYGPRCIDLPAPHEGQQVKVVNIRDLTIGYDESTPDHIPVSDKVQFM